MNLGNGFFVKVFDETENYFSIELSNKYNNYCLLIPNIKGREQALHDAESSRRIVHYVLYSLNLLNDECE